MTNRSFIGRERGEPFIARDGALVFELFRNTGLNIKNMSMASGYLEPRQKALPHFHKFSEEIYYVVSGSGRCRVRDAVEKIREGEAVYIPVGTIHALENTSRTKTMKILAICSPAYQDNDIFFV